MPVSAAPPTGVALTTPGQRPVSHLTFPVWAVSCTQGGMAAVSAPDLVIVGPGGRRVIVGAVSADDRVGDLADALGIARGAPLAVDGRLAARADTLSRADVRRGSSLDVMDPARVADRGAAVVTVVCEGGPGAGVAVPLPAGRHVVGRSPSAAVTIGDASLEPHHALLEVTTDGHAAVFQLTGRVPCRLDGEPISGRCVLADGVSVTLGASRLRVGSIGDELVGPATLAMTAGDAWRRTLRRTPRVVPRWEPDPIPVPDALEASSRPGVAGLVMALCTTIGAVVMAVVMGSPMFLLFGAIGLLASGGMWAVGRVGAAREGRRHRAGRDRAVATFTTAVDAQRDARWRHHVATLPGIAEAVDASTSVRADVWSRRPAHEDVHRVAVGWGPVEWDVVLDHDARQELAPELAAVVGAAGRFADAAVPVDLGSGAALAVIGTSAAAIARSIIVQLVTWVGPADLRVIAIVDQPDDWDWCRWLPHAVLSDGAGVVDADDAEHVTAALAAADDDTGRHVVVVTDRADILTQRTGAVRRFLGGPTSSAIVAALDRDSTPPAMCRSVLEVGSIGLAKWWADASFDAHPVTIHAAGVTAADAARAARALAGLADPEDPTGGTAALDGSVGIGELVERHGPGPIDDPIAIAAGWRNAGSDPPPMAVLGTTADGVVALDLVRDGPHALVAGTTGAGKSELLRTLVVTLAAQCSPDHLTFVLVDYKGGATFDACADLPHTVGVVTDLDDHLAERALVSLDAELRRRERVLRAAGAADLTEFRSVPDRDVMPRLVVVIDEFATLAAELPDFLAALVGIAQRGRSLGVHLVLATQRPAGVVSDDIRANTNLRIALRLQDVADARDVVGDDGPVSFPRRVPGRAMVRLGPGEHVVFQAARCTGPARLRMPERLHVVAGPSISAEPGEGADDTELAVLVRSIRNAAALSDIAAPHRPWLPPLPISVSSAECDAGAVGLVDVPAEQRRRPLCWSPSDGNLALVGAVGSGVTSALLALVTELSATRDPGSCHVYVIDGRGDHRLDALAELEHCGGVVRPHERERVGRMIRRLAAALDARRAAGGRAARPDIVVAIDGAGALRAALDSPHDGADFELLQRVVVEGAAVGIASVLTGERAGAIPPAQLASCAGRWVFHLDDPAESTMLGLPAGAVPPSIPGRVVIVGSRLDAQIADGSSDTGLARRGPGGPPPVGVLPNIVEIAPTGSVGGDGGFRVVVGIEFDTLGPAGLDVPDGEHMLVAGPARSGRTSALRAIAAGWRAANPSGQLVVVAPRQLDAWPERAADLASAVAVMDALPCGGAGLLVIDDAERVDDPTGVLAALVTDRRPGVLVVAAGRPDALRSAYGHWTGLVRRSRIGLLMAACADVDGDLLGEMLPRRLPLPARPGLAWVIDAAPRRLAQLALVGGGGGETGGGGVSRL